MCQASAAVSRELLQHEGCRRCKLAAATRNQHTADRCIIDVLVTARILTRHLNRNCTTTAASSQRMQCNAGASEQSGNRTKDALIDQSGGLMRSQYIARAFGISEPHVRVCRKLAVKVRDTRSGIAGGAGTRARHILRLVDQGLEHCSRLTVSCECRR